ncbi:SGT1-domain-containing protein [Anaeromyces robustus]|uniref:SGT1-domain-containing protein n=1 Tax=Anaeromyces robustus TaxID=1754192 RepID=A0A1Y1XHZ4_9FUNG|nr:SGT1-domain-containing protein [Anaeromyces robustus]|eukprot:ORX85322.1 SGT1-domain-containing protein [Anaeromyces robustus]
MNELFEKNSIEDNYVDYCLYIPNLKDNVENPNKDNLEAALIDISIKIFSFINQYTQNYIWQKEQFQLKICYSTELEYPYLSGKTIIGDCMDDEWFITFLLFEISKEFKNCIISVKDNDDEFLLIEAANFLPKWLEPENCENRVFIYQGNVHIIPYPTTPYELMLFPAGKIYLSRALDIIIGPGKTEASKEINNAINLKIKEYPQKIESDFHYTKCYIPLKIAHLLYHEPQLISSAINAFYYRGPEGMKACSKMRNFSIDNQVMTKVKFTKTLYAQLVSQQFFPPKIYHLPNPNSPNFKSYELGMKLSCAFEMLLADPVYKNLDQDNKNHSIENYTFSVDPEWNNFKKKFEKLGFFNNKDKLSIEYKRTERMIKEKYLEIKSHLNESSYNPLSRIRYLLKKDLIDPSLVENNNFKDDDDSWMNINENELDNILNEKEQDFKNCLSDNDDFDDMSDMDEEEKKEMKELSKLFGNFSSFIEKESSYKGVNNMDNINDNYEGDDDNDNEFENIFSKKIDLNPNIFMKVLQNELGFNINKSKLTEDNDQNVYEDSDFSSSEIEEKEEEEEEDNIKQIYDESNKNNNNNKSQMQNKIFESDKESKDDTNNNKNNDKDEMIETYYEVMDHELYKTKLSKDFKREDKKGKKESINNNEDNESDNDNDEDNDEDVDYKPVQLDLNLVQNLLDSFEAQEGNIGPTTSILKTLGQRLPKRNKDNEITINPTTSTSNI